MTELRRGTVLYGMMGCGKTTLGEGLANHLGQPFTDTDQLIERRFGRTCAEIIANGDFTDRQTETIMAYSPILPEIIATGGSVATYPRLVEHLGKFGIGIFINVDPEALEERLPAERIAALNNPLKLSFKDLYAARSELYRAAADYTLYVPGGESADATLGRVIDLRDVIAR